jgi:hypothetical protein
MRTSSAASNPNILLIMVDPFAAPALEAYGGRIAKTPDLNPLAKAHSVFGTHYRNFPIRTLLTSNLNRDCRRAVFLAQSE